VARPRRMCRRWRGNWGIEWGLLYRWQRHYIRGGVAALRNSGRPRPVLIQPSETAEPAEARQAPAVVANPTLAPAAEEQPGPAVAPPASLAVHDPAAAAHRIAELERKIGQQQAELERKIGQQQLELDFFAQPCGMKRAGWVVNHKRVQRIRRVDNLLCVTGRTFRPATTDARHQWKLWPNLVQNLIATNVNQLWVADITYV